MESEIRRDSVSFLCSLELTTWLGFSRHTWLVLGLQGFVLTVVFAKTYTLVPSYLGDSIDSGVFPAIHYPLFTAGVLLMAFADGFLLEIGVWIWSLGVAVLISSILRVVGGGVLSGETGTSKDKRERERVDRVSNFFVAASYIYLVVATASLVLYGFTASTVHLFAAGTAALLVYSVGFRLLPRSSRSRHPRSPPPYRSCRPRRLHPYFSPTAYIKKLSLSGSVPCSSR